MDKISVMIIAKNEEARIEEALKSAQWADEIIVVDSFSTDRTVEIAKKYTDKIFQRAFDDFSAQKNFALSKCSNNWIFSLDCDERISPGLQKAILSAADTSYGYSAYKIKRINKIFGKELRYAAGNDYPVRLFNKERAKFLQPIHEILDIEGRIGTLEGELIHASTPDLRSEFDKTERYTEHEARWLLERNIKPSLVKLCFYPPLVFLDLFIIKKGFLDGYAGFLFAFASARYSYIKYLKARRLFKNTAYLENKISQRFNELHKQFPDTIDPGDARLNALLEMIADFKGKNILEVGCGKGRFLREVAKRGANCTGIDLSENFLNEGRAKGIGAFLKASATNIPFSSGTFDVVFAVEVIEHLPDLMGFFEEARRVLKNDGKLIVIDRNKFSINNRRFMAPNVVIKRYHELKNEWMYPNNFPFREIWFNPRKVNELFKKYFKEAGFTYVRSDGEKKKWWHFIFKLIPQARHFVLWHGSGRYDGFMQMPEVDRRTVVTREFGPALMSVREMVNSRPLITTGAFTNDRLSNIFCLRIDADEYEQVSFSRYHDLFETYKNAVTIFFNVNSFKENLREIEKCKAVGADVQSHGFYHYTYNDYESNVYNIRKARQVFDKLGIRTKGFAAPMGKWNWELMKALEGEGYEYSSDFAYDYLGLPTYPSMQGVVSSVLEIPIFPVAPELFFRAGDYTLENIIGYYKGAIDEMAECGLPAIIYAHTSIEYKDVPVLLKELVSYAVSIKKMQPVSMTGINDIWRNGIPASSAGKEVKVPDGIYLGKDVEIPLDTKIKERVKGWIDFERITPPEELRCAAVKKAVKLLARKCFKTED
jgi:ubiquinone/menaquinone biosynthesis C-methylase UbiE